MQVDAIGDVCNYRLLVDPPMSDALFATKLQENAINNVSHEIP